VGTESGKVPFENWNVVDRAGYLRWRPVEADTPLHRDQWFWHPNANSTLKSVDELMAEYNDTVGRGAQLMLGLAPDRTGRIPAEDVARLAEFGARLKAVYGNNLALKHEAVDKNEERALDGDENTFWSPQVEDGSVPTLTVTFPHPVMFDRVMTMERLNDGQHVEEYSVEVLLNGAWKQVAHANAIGHKKIDIFDPVTSAAIRLKLLKTSGQAGIREFAVFNGTQVP
jgi:alpha-L-fucosidase